jgi:hypothetical protein
MGVEDELGRVWKEAFMISFKVLSQHFPKGMEENHDRSIWLTVLRFENWTPDFPNAK